MMISTSSTPSPQKNRPPGSRLVDLGTRIKRGVVRFLRSENGRSLPAALIAITLGTVLLVPFLSFVSSRSLSTRSAAGAFEAQYAADAGVEYAIWSLLEDPSARPTSLPEPVNGHNPSLTITEVSSGSTWVQDPPADPNRNISSGGGMAFDGGNLFYALVGGGDNKFYRYNSTSDSWTQLSQIPKNLQIFPPPPDNYSLSVDTGSDLVYTGPWNNDLYALVVGDPRGRPSTPEADFLYRYSISSNSWELAAKTPGELGAGASLEYDGGSSLYVFQGESSTLWKYSTSGWEFLEPLPFPGTVGAGGTLVYNGNNYLYALLGGGSNEFWRYDINANDWTELSTLPSSVNSGGSLAYNGDDDIYALPGGSNEVWQYTISTNTWSLLSTTPAGRDIGSGGDIVLINSEKGYVLRGGNNREFWKFTAAPPLYDILSQAGDLEIYARVELVGSSSTITFWKID